MKRWFLPVTAAVLLMTATACGRDATLDAASSEAVSVSSTAPSSQKASPAPVISADAAEETASATDEAVDPKEACDAFSAARTAAGKLTAYRYSASTAYAVLVEGSAVTLDSAKTEAVGNGEDFVYSMTGVAKDNHNKQLSASMDAIYASKEQNATLTYRSYTDYEDETNNEESRREERYEPQPLSRFLSDDFAFTRQDLASVSRAGEDRYTFTLRADAAAAIVRRLFSGIGLEEDVSSVSVSYFVVTARLTDGVLTNYQASVICKLGDGSYQLNSSFTVEDISPGETVSAPDWVK